MARTTKQEKKTSKPSNGLLDKILSNSNSDIASIIDSSSFFNDMEMIPTDVPILNLAYSGKIDGGFSGGLITIAGPSKHFKSSFGLVSIKAHQKKYPEGFVIFYDSEGGITINYLKKHGIDTSRVIHDFVTDVEELKHRMVPQLDGLEKGDPVMMFVDSIGNLSSKREYDNAIEGNTAADMTRAKELKSLSRLINGKLKIKRIPCIAVNHSYQTLELYSKTQVGGGTGFIYSSDTIWIVGRSQDKNKDTNEIEGWYFTITIDKSRFVKEKLKFNVHVTYDGGIAKYSGLAEIADELGVIQKTKIGKKIAYSYKGLEVLDDVIDTHEEFWTKVFNESDFKKLAEEKYTLDGKITPIEENDE